LTCVVVLKTLWHYRASVWSVYVLWHLYDYFIDVCSAVSTKPSH